MRLKHFLEHMVKLDGWRLDEGVSGPYLIRRYEGADCECPMIAVGRVAIPCNNLDQNAYKAVGLCLDIPTAIAAASDNYRQHPPHAPENIAELRRHLLKAARVA